MAWKAEDVSDAWLKAFNWLVATNELQKMSEIIIVRKEKKDRNKMIFFYKGIQSFVPLPSASAAQQKF